MAQKSIKVRRGVPDDAVNIGKLLKKGWNEQTVEYAPINDLRGYQWILGILEEGFIVVADLNGRIVGAACLSPFRPPWSTVWMGDMEFFYILPSFRKEGIAASMIKAVEKFADTFDAAIMFGLQTGEKPLVKDRMMKIAGWEYVGGKFLRAAHGRKQEENTDQ